MVAEPDAKGFRAPEGGPVLDGFIVLREAGFLNDGVLTEVGQIFWVGGHRDPHCS